MNQLTSLHTNNDQYVKRFFLEISTHLIKYHLNPEQATYVKSPKSFHAAVLYKKQKIPLSLKKRATEKATKTSNSYVIPRKEKERQEKKIKKLGRNEKNKPWEKKSGK